MCQISNFLRYPCYHKLGCPSLATLVVQRCCTSTRSARGAEYKWRRWRAMTSGSNFIVFFKRKKNNSYFKWSHVNDSAWTSKSYMGSFFFFFHICDLCILISVLFAWLHPISVKEKNGNYWKWKVLFYLWSSKLSISFSNFQYFFFSVLILSCLLARDDRLFPHCEKLCFLACRNWTAVCRTS